MVCVGRAHPRPLVLGVVEIGRVVLSKVRECHVLVSHHLVSFPPPRLPNVFFRISAILVFLEACRCALLPLGVCFEQRRASRARLEPLLPEPCQAWRPRRAREKAQSMQRGSGPSPVFCPVGPHLPKDRSSLF